MSNVESRVDVLSARDVPLGGPRALLVRRTLPQRARTLIGAWCFADHYGPVDATGTGMDVPPHPHTGLQTVSWLFGGEIEHRDTLGSHVLVRPGEMNLMTGGYGIAHSEVSTPDTTVIHGVQLWVALPEEHRDTARDFQHHVPEPVRVDGAEIKVFGNVAVAVAACETVENGADVNRNVEVLLLVREDGRWKIAAQAWDKASESSPVPGDPLAG